MCVCKNIIDCTDIIARIFLFQVIVCTQRENIIMVRCILDRIDFLATVLNTYIKLLIGGGGDECHYWRWSGANWRSCGGISGESYLPELSDKYYNDDGVSVADIQGPPATYPDLAYLLSCVIKWHIIRHCALDSSQGL